MSALWIYRLEKLPIEVHPTQSVDVPLIHVTRTLGDRFESNEPITTFKLWSDGKFSWREVPYSEGSRLFTSRVCVEKIDRLFGKLSAARLLDRDLQQFSVGFGSGYDSIEINAEEGTVRLSSWHEFFEDSQQLVCTQDGLAAVAPDRDRESYIDEWSRPYELLRINWDIIRDFSNSAKERARAANRATHVKNNDSSP